MQHVMVLAIIVIHTLINIHQDNPREFKKIEGILTLAGSTGLVKKDGTIDSITGMSIEVYKEYLKTIKEDDMFNIDIEKTIEEYLNINKNIYEALKNLPPNINSAFIVASGDELTSVEAATDIQNKLGHGRIVIDHTQKPTDDNSLTHDFTNIPTKRLLRMLTHEGYRKNAKEKLDLCYRQKVNADEMKKKYQKYN